MLPCRDCGIDFDRTKQRGRPPVRCPKCREFQGEIVVPCDPETLYTGPVEKLSGNREDRPHGGEAQCVLCNRIFNSYSACESHKLYPQKDNAAICVDPFSIGMIAKERRGLPVWSRPLTRIFE